VSEHIGIVIGKFMPLHAGHIALIRFAAERCTRVLISVDGQPDHPIPVDTRAEWIRKTFADDPRIEVHATDEPLPDDPVPSRAVSSIWAEYLKRRFPQATAIVSSETYGDYVAEYMGISHIPFDPNRAANPVSGTAVREHPFRHWELIAPAARSYFAQRICVYGPESTGKSVMTEYLARRFKTTFVPEMARELLAERGVAGLVREDFAAIGELHAREILRRTPEANRILFVDTDHITTKIYARHYFDFTPDFPAWIEEANRYGLYLFLDIDVPWIEDPQRDSWHCREEHRALFLGELERAHLPHVVISGSWEERNRKAVAAVLERWPDMEFNGS